MVEIEKEYTNSYLIVFSPGTPILENILEKKESLDSEILLDGEWTVNLLPTLNNKWGDFRLPASNEYIGAEARVFRFMAENQAPKSWMEKILRMRIGKKEFMDMDLNMRLVRIHSPIGKPFRFLGSMEYGIIRVLKDIMG